MFWRRYFEAEIFLLVTLLVCAALALEDDSPYCAVRFRRLCQGKGLHVACEYSIPGPGPYCQNYTQVNFDRELKHYIISYINRRRQRIAAGFERVRGGERLPRPRIMMFVEWDRELATLAQRLADQCQFIHDDCRATVRYPYAGQTVGEVRLRRGRDGLGAKPAVRRVLDAWWGERRRAEPRHLIEPFHLSAKGSAYGHFSQFAVWSLRAVGCGAARHGTERPRLLLVCDFSHTNMLGQRTIEPGPLAVCPENTRRRPHSGYPLLCATYHRDSEYEEPSDVEYRVQDEDDDDGVDETTTTTTEYRGRPSVIRRTWTPPTDPDIGEDVTVTRRFVTRPKDKPFTRIPESFNNKLAWRMRTGQKENQKDEEYRVLGINRVKEDKHWGDAGKSPAKADRRLQIERDRQKMKTLSTPQLGNRPFNDWVTRNPAKKKWTGAQEEDGDQTTHISLRTLRQRGNWKQTSDRPRRPGEAALLHISTTDVPVPMVHETKTSGSGSLFLMDKDDVDQLFKDTGFQPAWRKIKS